MEHETTASYLLDLIERPAFCVENGVIIRTNQAASQMLICTGMQIYDLITNDRQAYTDFTGGSLALSLDIAGNSCRATVRRIEKLDTFLLETEASNIRLQTLALAAQHLRVPLGNIMAVTEAFLSEQALRANPSSLAHMTQINRGLYQLQRMIGDMSDACRYQISASIQMATADIERIFYEALEKAGALLEACGVHINFTGLSTPVYCLADAEMLERAVYNLISNAVKFGSSPGIIDAKLTQNGDMLYFTIANTGAGIPDEVLPSVFSRYQRTPQIEDGSFGIGLGISLVRSAAAAHGGTVLIDCAEGRGCRVTMTLAITQDNSGTVRSPLIRIGDYAGGRDHGLLELSDILPNNPFDTTVF